MIPSTFFAELKRRNVLRACAFYVGAVWALAQGLAQLFPVFGVPDWIVRWFVVAAVIGFPFVPALAWFYEFTPHGLKRESEIDPADSITRRTGKKLDHWLIVVLALAVVLLLTNQFVPRKGVNEVAADATAKSIAVLPLVNESGDKDQQYFSDGLSEDLITALAQFGGLKVISRNSSFQFRDTKLGSATIGQTLGVAHLLEGSVRHLGDDVRINVELVDVTDGSTSWSQRYDRPYQDLFKLQDDITRAVASELKATLLGQTLVSDLKPPSGNLGAYNALLQGNFHFDRISPDNFRKAIGYYDTAIGLDPRYALAYAKRSFAWRALADQYLEGVAQADAYAKARAAAKTALELAPDLAFAHVASGWLLMDVDFDFAGAETEFRRAVTLAPADPVAENGLAALLAGLGRLDAAVDLAHKALAVDPLHASWYTNLSFYLIALGRLDDAEQALHKAIELQPGAAVNHTLLAVVEVRRGHAELALQAAQKEGDGMWRRYALALAQQARGDRVAADAAMQALIDQDATGAPFQIASVYAFRQQPEQVFAWLDRAWSARDPGLTGLLYDPFLLEYRSDPRFAAFCAKVGLPVPDASTAFGNASG